MTENIIDLPIDFTPPQKLSFAIAGGTSGPTTYLVEDETGQYTVNQITGLGGGRGDVAFGDLNGDGLDDLFSFRGYASDNVSLNDGNGGLVSTGQVLDSGYYQAFGLELADIDSDGDLDALTANQVGGVRLWENDGTGTFTDALLISTIHSLDVAVADFDGNGVQDIVGARTQLYANQAYVGSGGLQFLYNYAAGNTTVDIHAPSQNISMVHVDAEDFDGDGDVDVFATANKADPSLVPQEHMLLLNDGSGNFTIGAQIAVAGYISDSTPGDFDGDGNLDMAISLGTAGVQFLLNDGTGTFISRIEATVEPAFGLFAADLGGDGSDELVVASRDTLKAFSLEAASLVEEFSVNIPDRGFHVDGGILEPNDPPLVAEEDGGTATVTLTDFVDLNDPNLDTSSITFEITTGPDQGTAQIINDELIYDPGGAFQHLGEGETAEVTCEITLTDGSGATYTDTLTITVTGSAEYCVHTAGGEFLVNSAVTADQKYPSIAGLPNGGLVIAWDTSDATQDGNLHGIKAKVLNADNSVAIPEFVVNLGNFGNQRFPEVAALSNGGFVVTWDAQLSNSTLVLGRVFDATGAAVRNDFHIAEMHAGRQSFREVAALDNGGFVVSWQTDDPAQDGDGNAVKARVFDAAGMPTTSEFLVNSTTVSDQFGPHVASLADGSFVVAWASEDPTVGGTDLDVRAQIFDATGAAQGPELLLNSGVLDAQGPPSIAGLPDGGFVATWGTSGQSGGSYYWGVNARIFDASGAPRGDDFVVKSEGSNLNFLPEVTVLDQGDFIVTWTTSDNDFGDIKARHYALNGTPIGNEFVVNAETADGQYYSDIATTADGGYAIAWQSHDTTQDGSGTSIKAVRYDAQYSTIVDIEISKTVISEVQIANLPAATFEATGIDGAQYTYTLVDDPSGAFSIEGDQLIVSDNSTLNSQTSPILPIVVRATDDSGNSFDKIIEITVGLVADPSRLAAGDEFLVNTNSDNIQTSPDLAALSDGRFLATWWTFDDTADGDSSAVKGQIFDATGTPDGTEFLVNTQAAGSQGLPSAAGLTNGGFVVAWQTWDAAQDGSASAIKAQLFDATGMPEGTEFLVNTTTANAQERPYVTGLEDGGFVVSWQSGLLGYDLNTQTYDASGTPVGGENVVSAFPSVLTNGEITTLSNGNLVSVWDTFGASGSGDVEGVQAQIFDPSGTAIGGPLTIREREPNYPDDPKIVALKYGGFVAVWQELDGIKAEMFDDTGNIVSFDLISVSTGDVSLADTPYDSKPVVAALADGGFVVAWEQLGFPSDDGNGSGIMARTFDVGGYAASDVFVVNEETASDQQKTSIVGLENGGFVVSWNTHDATQDGSMEAIKARVFEPVEIASPIGVFADDTYTTFVEEYGFVADALAAATEGQALDIFEEYRTGYVGEQNVAVDGLTLRGNAPFAGEFYLGAGVDDFTLIGSNDAEVYGGPEDNNIAGSGGGNILSGGDGNDTITGSSGGDFLSGDGDNDSLLGGPGVDTLTGGEGNDTLRGEGGQDELSGGEGDDFLDGGTNPDTLVGGAGDDTLFGQIGADDLSGEDGNDRLVGGNAKDTMDGGADDDTLSGQGSEDYLTGGTGDDSLNGGASADSLYGDAGADTLLGGAFNDLLYGGDDNDSLNGSSGLDTLYGDQGNDTLIGGSNSDMLHGGDEDDYLDGGIGKDTLNGDTGNDTLLGGNANDKLYGGDDDDSLDGGSGSDRLEGNDGSDILIGGAGADTILGGSGNDSILGGATNDRLEGGSGNDTIDGGIGNDTVFAGSGNDTIIVAGPGEGFDSITGGSGSDTFVFVSGFEATTIADFSGSDVIDLTAVTGIASFADLAFNQGADTVIDLGGGDTILLEGVTSALQNSDFVF